MVGWWLVFCLVILTGYKSSLISHLTVNIARTHPPETMRELADSHGWEWGIESWIMSGIPLEYFSRHTDPMVKKIYKELELVTSDEGLNKVLKNHYSLLDLTYYITIHIASRYTDARGQTPFFISKKGFSLMATFGWGVRLGAPFHQRFNKLTLQLEAAGITSYLLQDVISQRIKENRINDKLADRKNFGEDDTDAVVLSLDHMQGSFYLLFLGCGLAVLTLLGEKVTKL
ncbi:hypothetical protein Pmani_015031 [Petrolisthes manimaculis]|uniref:Ionotropic glutamate receptor C-terminal domain-containing protein n=1 Tax=Petrolisthes manimaculis TaxID=1843537 RepID=A0AAE1PV92_9EUCA|nr:hypothetical protein Pmani_015031 [Petrolisthes manimaculis]